jgi:L-lysine 2,3-aminomutase
MVPAFQPYTLGNLGAIGQLQRLPAEIRQAIAVVGRVFPFRTNAYVVNELIDWEQADGDPIFRLNFPCREMLPPHYYARIEALLSKGSSTAELAAAVQNVRAGLKPVAVTTTMGGTISAINGQKDRGIIHSYPETVLFFPAEGQMCHAHCTFCFRWMQFVGAEEEVFASLDVDSLVNYVRQRPEISDILFTGGDPLFMPAAALAGYVDTILAADIDHLTILRFGTKTLGYWPHRFLTDPDADDLLRLFERIVAKGKHVALVANINHPQELATDAVKKAIARIASTGAVIRTQSPLLRHINAQPETWVTLWREQVRLGLVPYYQFVMRDTGASHYFALPLVEAQDIFREAYRRVSGIGRTVRGPCMSTPQGKVEVLDVQNVGERKAILLRYLQARNQELVLKTFLAEYDEKAEWFTDLRPLRTQDRPFFPGMLQVDQSTGDRIYRGGYA